MYEYKISTVPKYIVYVYDTTVSNDRNVPAPPALGATETLAT
jgi:hypothetical protein